MKLMKSRYPGGLYRNIRTSNLYYHPVGASNSTIDAGSWFIVDGEGFKCWAFSPQGLLVIVSAYDFEE